VLVPSTMALVGDANWWLPKWLDRILPHIDIEGDVEGDRGSDADTSAVTPTADESDVAAHQLEEVQA